MNNNNQYSFWDNYSNGWKNYTNFQDKATRTQYWTFALVNSVIVAILALFSYPLSLIFSLAEIIPGIAIGVRRIRDTGKSPTNYCWIFFPIVGYIILLVFFLAPSNHYLNLKKHNDEEESVEPITNNNIKKTKNDDESPISFYLLTTIIIVVFIILLSIILNTSIYNI